MIEPIQIEQELYPSIVDTVVEMNNKYRECLGDQVFEFNGIYVSKHKITQKKTIHLPEDQSLFLIYFLFESHF